MKGILEFNAMSIQYHFNIDMPELVLQNMEFFEI